MNELLELTHPQLFDAATKVMSQLRSYPNTQDIARKWTSVFSGIAVIVNRATPAHTDRGGRPQWYDCLTSLGTFSSATLDLPELGLSLLYRPGTVVNICGNVLQHQVKGEWGAGDRVCYARFMRKAIFERFQVKCEGWVNRDDFPNPRLQYSASSS